MAGLTKRHFESLAAIIRKEVDAAPTKGGALTHYRIGEALADFCAEHNPGFDRARFLSACGLEDVA